MGDFSLITKLGRKHKKCSVAIINHPYDEHIPTFDSTAWSYDHSFLHTCLIATHTVTSNGNGSAKTHTASHSTDDVEFRGYSSMLLSDFFGIPHTLTGDIVQAQVKCLRAAYARLKETKRTRYSTITLQMLLHSLDVSVCRYNPLCSQILVDKCLTFDRVVHAKYIRDTKHTITQPAHATFLSQDHHGLHIPSLLLTQLQGRIRELDVRLNSPDPAQHGPPLARLAAMDSSPHQHTNLIRNAILSLARFGFQYRDADEPVITNTLQLLLHERQDKTLLGQPHTNACVNSNSPFTITGNSLEHAPYSHNNELHQWLQHMTNTQARTHALDAYPSPPLLYDDDEITTVITTATTTYHNDIMEYLTFTEWRRTTSQHPTIRPSYPLNTPVTAWNEYASQLHLTTLDKQQTPLNHITEFCNSIRLQLSSVSTSYPFITGSLHRTDNDIITILATYNSPLILTIDGSFKPSDRHHIYPLRQPQHPTIVHVAASVTITTINNSHPTTQWMDLPTIPVLSRVQPLPAAYGTNNITNNTAVLLARVMVCELLPENTPAIVICDSAIVHNQHLVLLGRTYTNRQRIRTVFSSISRMVAQRLEATSPRLPLDHPTHHTHPTIHDDTTATLIHPIMNQICRLPPCGKHGCHTSTLPQYIHLYTSKLSRIKCDPMVTRNVIPDPSYV